MQSIGSRTLQRRPFISLNARAHDVAQGPPFANYDHLRFYHKLNYESSNRSPLFLDGFKVHRTELN